MENVFYPFAHKTFSLPVCDCRICCMLDDGFFYPNKLTGDPHAHLAYELHCCEEGSYSVTLSQTGTVLTVHPGWILIIPPGCYHCARVLQAEANGEKHRIVSEVQKYTLRFRPEPISGAEPSLFSPVQQLLTNGPVQVALPEGIQLFRQILSELRGGAPYAEQAAELALQSLFLQLFRAILQNETLGAVCYEKKPESDEDLVRCERIIRYLDDHYAQPITEQDLAEEMHLSVRQISRIFSIQFRSSFHQVLGQIRLHQARKLLSRTALSVENIALKTGYGSPSTFYAAFRKAYGMSPRQYRLHAQKAEENLLI